MLLVYRYLIPSMWLAWAACWWVMSRDVKATERRESMGSRLLHIVPLVLAVVLVWVPRAPLPALAVRLLPRTAGLFWIGVALTALGLGFAVWARIQLGRNWSGIVTLKKEHELITSGPYRIARHPIYTGLLLAFLGSGAARGDVRGAVAVALVFLALWRKLRMEERWMRARFGARYEDYSQHVAALIPFVL
jgi:protein-S-isoprenylcysteine O-methyltransferase Ste14